MLIHADFTQPVMITAKEQQWIPSPQSGVERIMLDRIGAEKARATSIVRYAPNSHFPHHLHPGGEEILVLSGTFSADDDHYPAGWYLRNPPKSGHQPHSEKGAIIFVKLRQMLESEQQHVAINTNDDSNWQQNTDREVCHLYSSDNDLDGYEQVSLQRLQGNVLVFPDTVANGAELLVIKGALIDNDMIYEQNSWIRLPIGFDTSIKAGEQGATIYLKTGHLATIIGATSNDD